MKIGYFADGPWSHRALEMINSSKIVEVAFICVRADSSDIVLPRMAKELGVPCLKHPKVSSEEFLAQIAPFQCDLLVSMSFDQIFKANILQSTPKGIINCHAGKLPFYRGRNILNWALINDEKDFGITVHYVDEGIDTGDIILQRVFPITDNDSYSTLLEKSFEECAVILHESLVLLTQNKAPRISQKSIHPTGSYCGKRGPGDEVINWNQTSREIFNFVRSICLPGPQATTRYKDSEVKINRVKIIKDVPAYIGTPGQIIGRVESGWLVKTKDSFVEIYDVTTSEKLKVGERFV